MKKDTMGEKERKNVSITMSQPHVNERIIFERQKKREKKIKLNKKL
jgi:hypothetical protein